MSFCLFNADCGADGDEIIIGGTFQYAGTLETSNVAVWSEVDGWSALSYGLTDEGDDDGPLQRVISIVAYEPQELIFFGGTFSVTAQNPKTGQTALVRNLVAWDMATSSWQIVQQEIESGIVLTLEPAGEKRLYVGGRFSLVNQGNSSQVIYNLGLLDLSVPYQGYDSWLPVSPPCDVDFSECTAQTIYDIAVYPGVIDGTTSASQLYIGGRFHQISGNLINNVAQLSSSGQWQSLGSTGVSATKENLATVFSLAFSDDLSELYIAGELLSLAPLE